MKVKKLLCTIIAVAMVLGTMSIPAFADETEVWDGTAIDTSWYKSTDTEFTISTPAQLAGLAQIVNTSIDNFEGDTVILTENVDLGNKLWTPIGAYIEEVVGQGLKNHVFKGTFDGSGKTISNLYAEGDQKQGLFGYTQVGEVKNFTLENANVIGTLCVGAVCGIPYTTTYTDISLAGNIKVEGATYVGGALGYSAYRDIINVDVHAEPGSYVKAESGEDRTYIGGLIGFMAEGGQAIKDCDVAIDVEGSTCDVGGITGMLHYGNRMENCTYTGSLKLGSNDAEFGGLCGTVNVSKGAPSIVSSKANIIKAENLSGDVTDSITAHGEFYNTDLNTGYVFEVKDTTVNGRPAEVPKAVAQIGELKYLSLDAAMDKAKVGDTIELINDVNLPDGEYITVDADDDIILDLNGYALSSSTNAANKTINVSGKLTIKDSSENQTGTITDSTGQYAAVWVAAESADLTLESGNIISSTRAVWVSNGAKLSMTGGKVNGNCGIRVSNTNPNVASSALISGGEISGDTQGVYVNANVNSNDRVTSIPAEVTVSGNAKISSVNDAAITVRGIGGKVIVNDGTIIGGDGENAYAIAGNGTVDNSYNYGGTVIEINGGTIKGSSERNCAIYHPQVGDLKITGGTISGYGGVQMCAGKLEISGNPTITAVGEKDFTKNDTDGYVFDGAAVSVVNRNYSGTAPVVSILQGTFVSEKSDAVMAYTFSNKVESEWAEAKEHFVITGGTFDSDVTEYVPEGYGKIDISNGGMIVTDPSETDATYVAGEVTVDFVKNTDDITGRTYDIFVKATDGKVINRLTAAELKFAIKQLEDKETGKNGDVTYTITNTDHVNIIPSEDGRYEFNFDGIDDVADKTDTAIKIGEVVFGGYGRFAFAAVTDEKNKVHATKLADNIITTYTADGAATGEGVLTVNEATTGDEIDEETTEPSIITDTLETVKNNLTVKVTFPNAISDNANEYQQMKVTITGGDLDAPIVKKLGTDVTLNADGNYEFTEELSQFTSYNVTVEGEGYRTVRYSVNIEKGDKTLTFWNNVKDVADVIEADKTTGAVKTTFLAGDIVRDNEINLYDLSAVVSYFGMIDLDKTPDGKDFAKYDLNRDGVIDSKDIAMVLVSWGY